MKRLSYIEDARCLKVKLHWWRNSEPTEAREWLLSFDAEASIKKSIWLQCSRSVANFYIKGTKYQSKPNSLLYKIQFQGETFRPFFLSHLQALKEQIQTGSVLWGPEDDSKGSLDLFLEMRVEICRPRIVFYITNWCVLTDIFYLICIRKTHRDD